MTDLERLIAWSQDIQRRQQEFTRDSLVDILEDQLDPDFVAKVRALRRDKGDVVVHVDFVNKVRAIPNVRGEHGEGEYDA